MISLQLDCKGWTPVNGAYVIVNKYISSAETLGVQWVFFLLQDSDAIWIAIRNINPLMPEE